MLCSDSYRTRNYFMQSLYTQQQTFLCSFTLVQINSQRFPSEPKQAQGYRIKKYPKISREGLKYPPDKWP
jgi:hypothetical protein